MVGFVIIPQMAWSMGYFSHLSIWALGIDEIQQCYKFQMQIHIISHPFINFFPVHKFHA